MKAKFEIKILIKADNMKLLVNVERIKLLKNVGEKRSSVNFFVVFFFNFRFDLFESISAFVTFSDQCYLNRKCRHFFFFFSFTFVVIVLAKKCSLL